MRIGLVTHIRSRIGGTESYVEQLAAGLHAAGHDIALWHEHDGPRERGMIALPATAPVWSVEQLGASRALGALRDWKADVILSHGVSTPAVEESILEIRPTVMFIHAYHGACISGTKSRLSPSRMPCPRPLGTPCLLHYLPRRCGGLSPVTMVRRYALETRRRDMLGRYAALLTASSHMRREYLQYGVPPERIRTVGLMLAHAVPRDRSSVAEPGDGHDASADIQGTWRLLLVARLTALKGGAVLLESLPHIREAFAGRIVLTIAGDGPERPSLERQARRLQSQLPNVEIRFVGWLGSDALAATTRATDLLVVPSIWPEPFGLVGPEAGAHGVPSAAFAVGGIPDWLEDGVNGHLAPPSPPTAAGLATAIARSLSDPRHHARLRAGALQRAKELSPDLHVPRVVAVLDEVARSHPHRRAT